jgi:hypothetical protein
LDESAVFPRRRDVVVSTARVDWLRGSGEPGIREHPREPSMYGLTPG